MGLKGSVFEDNVANIKNKLQKMMTHHMNLLTTITEQAAVQVHPDKNLVIDWSKALIKDAASNVEDEWVFWVPKLS
jgi:tryptophanyl-tRNA synthetase